MSTEQRPSVPVTSVTTHLSLTLPSLGAPRRPSLCPLPLPHTTPLPGQRPAAELCTALESRKNVPAPGPPGKAITHCLPPLLSLQGSHSRVTPHETYRPGHSVSWLSAFLSPAKAFHPILHLSTPGPSAQAQVRGLPPQRGLPEPPANMKSKPSLSPCEGPVPALRASQRVDRVPVPALGGGHSADEETKAQGAYVRCSGHTGRKQRVSTNARHPGPTAASQRDTSLHLASALPQGGDAARVSTVAPQRHKLCSRAPQTLI